MKYLPIVTALFLVATVSAQELKIYETDDFTGDENRMTEYYEIGSSQLTSTMTARLACATMRVGEGFGIDMWSTVDQGCAGAFDNYVIFLFEDSSTVKLSEDLVDIECEERASSRYVISPSDFKGKTLKRIRFSQSKGHVDYDVIGEYTLQELIQAVSN